MKVWILAATGALLVSTMGYFAYAQSGGPRGERGPRGGERGERGHRSGQFQRGGPDQRGGPEHGRPPHRGRDEGPPPRRGPHDQHGPGEQCGASGSEDRGPRDSGGRDMRRPQHEGRQGPPPPDPLLSLFDNNDDGSISSDEIAAAADVLKRLDQNKDGNISHDELPRPPRPDGPPPQDRSTYRDGPHRDGPSRDGDRDRRPPPRGERDHDHPHGETDDARPPRDDDGARPNRRRPEREEAEGVTKKSHAPEGTVVLNGGFETDPVDGGRPVGLIAAALGVKPDVFRQAFDKVRPARGGSPSAARARENKETLMAVLEPLGITNERLDEVSDYYRYRPESGTLWRHRQAEVKAVILDREVKSFEITDPGAGYLTAPTVQVEGYPHLQATAELAFDKELSKNGRIANIVIMTDI